MTAAKIKDQISVVAGQQEPGQIRDIPVDQLFVSPAEVRKTIDPKALLRSSSRV
jgi:hypothetical protein